jgi:hypothetical protein
MATKETEKVETTPVDTDGADHDRFSHYVLASELERAVMDGIPCTALCGKKWLPQKDHTKYPVCPECKEKWLEREDD